MLNRLASLTVPVIVLLAVTYARCLAVKPQVKASGTSAGIPHQSMCAKRATSSKCPHSYHKDPPNGPLPATLDPAKFLGHKRALVAYSIAAKIRELLYQEPCFCPCNSIEGHQSLLDCFTSDHGTTCQGCQIGVVFIYERFKAGKNASEIREEMERGDLWKTDLEKYAETHYDEYANQLSDQRTPAAKQ